MQRDGVWMMLSLPDREANFVKWAARTKDLCDELSNRIEGCLDGTTRVR